MPVGIYLIGTQSVWQEVSSFINYVMTYHTRKEMNDDDLTIYDVEHCILSGKILERQRDRVTVEWKYRVRGETIGRDKIEVIVKLGPTDKLVMITVYVL